MKYEALGWATQPGKSASLQDHRDNRVLGVGGKDRKDKAEGLVFTDALGWLVALDLQRAAPNLHELALFPG